MADVTAATANSAAVNTELAMRRTGMAFQRTRLAADRTLMGVIRTSLSLISFGFTIFQFFKKLRDSNVLTGSAPARNFGTTLVLLGIGMLILGLVYHIMFMIELRKQREQMKATGLVHGESGFPASLVVIVAVCLLLIGLVAAASMVFHVGPYE
jgi:inner membrane protein YidH